MATDAELSEAALAFIEQSDNNNPENVSTTVFGNRGHGYLFEYDEHFGTTMVNEWAPFVDDRGVFHECHWTGEYIERFIGDIASLAGIETNEEEIGKVVGIIKLLLPEIDG